jgi:hypothetical protein
MFSWHLTLPLGVKLDRTEELGNKHGTVASTWDVELPGSWEKFISSVTEESSQSKVKSNVEPYEGSDAATRSAKRLANYHMQAPK